MLSLHVSSPSPEARSKFIWPCQKLAVTRNLHRQKLALTNLFHLSKMRFVPGGPWLMLGISGNFKVFFKTDGPIMLAGATPSQLCLHSHSRNRDHARKMRTMGSSFLGVASLPNYCADDSHPSVRLPAPRTKLQRPCPNSVNEISSLHLRLLTHAVAAMEFTDRM